MATIDTNRRSRRKPRAAREADQPGRGLQLSLPTPPSWGGKRRGAGRKPRDVRRRSVGHAARDPHGAAHPVHVTLRARRERGSLRNHLGASALDAAIRRARRDDFHVAHYSIQRDHVHLIVEAASRDALSAGMRRLTILMAHGLNRRLGLRRGKLWADRYHRHDLKTPREVRNALVYVLANVRKHAAPNQRFSPHALDPFSSALWFSGYEHLRGQGRVGREDGPVEPRRTWLLRVGWQRHGLLRASEGPIESVRMGTTASPHR